MNDEKKLTIQFICAVLALVVGAFLLIFGIVVDPRGVIDNSVLVATGEILTFCGSVLGIDVNYKKSVLKIKRDIEKK